MLRAAILAATFAALVVFFGGSATATGGPMADAGLDQSVTLETTVHLDGTGSSHPNGELSGYEWTIRTPDGRVIEPACPDCERTRFTPSTVGRYEVTLAVTGPDGVERTDTLYVYVEDAGPDVSLSGDRTPEPSESVTYTATAESADAELEEIAWAVEDQIVAVRSLEGSTDESQLSLAFADADTYRVQVVVRDSNGRTAYDQLYVQPAAESPPPTSWSEVDPPDCSDSEYAARNSLECWDIEPPEMTPEPAEESGDESQTGPFEIYYETEGYETDWFLGMQNVDSSFLGTTRDSVGVAGGEYAPWNDGVLERTYESTIGAGARYLFGQEEETVTCEVSGDEIINRGCSESVFELERTGETTNTYSPTQSGVYSEYGLEGGERVGGINPLNLEEDESANVTIVVQPQEDGVVDKVVHGVDSSADRLRESVDGVLSDKENSETELNQQNAPSGPGGEASNWDTEGSNDGRIVSGGGDDANSAPNIKNPTTQISSTNNINETTSSVEPDSSVNPNDGGLVA